jgi:acyl carrier protein
MDTAKAGEQAVEKTAALLKPPTRHIVFNEICRCLQPFRVSDTQELRGETDIAKELAIDSLAVMDMVMELEDCFDVSIPMNVVAGIQTIDELADTILKLDFQRRRARRV